MDEAKEALRADRESRAGAGFRGGSRGRQNAAAGKLDNTGKPWLSIHLHGALASLLRLACGLPAYEVVDSAAQMQKTPRGAGCKAAINRQSADTEFQSIDLVGELVLVAGAHFQKFLPLHQQHWHDPKSLAA